MEYNITREESNIVTSETDDFYLDCTDDIYDENSECNCEDCRYITELILIDKLKMKAVPEENTKNRFCTICLNSKLLNYCRFACSHSFHFDCILDWIIKRNFDCPICRKDIFK